MIGLKKSSFSFSTTCFPAFFAMIGSFDSVLNLDRVIKYFP